MEAERLYKNYNVHLVCEALNISRGSFYNHIKRNKRENAWYFLRREELRKEIRDIFYDTGETYGARKMTAALRQRDITASVHLVRELMAEMKKEELYRYRYRSERELKESINLFVERYNSERPHEKLKYKTPNQFEEMYLNTL